MVINATRSRRGYRVGPRSRGAASGLGCTPAEYLAKHGAPKKRPTQQLMMRRPQATINWAVRNGHRVVNVIRPLPVMQLIKSRSF